MAHPEDRPPERGGGPRRRRGSGCRPSGRRRSETGTSTSPDRIAARWRNGTRRLQDDGPCRRSLRRAHGLSPSAARAMIGFLARQREVTGSGPSASPSPPCRSTQRDPRACSAEPPRQARRGERRPAHALGRTGQPAFRPGALRRRGRSGSGTGREMIQTNDAILLLRPRMSASAAEILSLVTPGAWSASCARAWKGSGFFGARFRESAGTGAPPAPRLRAEAHAAVAHAAARQSPCSPPWLAVRGLPSPAGGVAHVPAGRVRPAALETSWKSWGRESSAWARRHAGAFPVLRGADWKQTNTLMYADDTPLRRRSRRTSAATWSASLRCLRTCGPP